LDRKPPDWATPDAADVAAVRRTVEDYFLGWFDGDAERMRRALHPRLVKRSYRSRDGQPAALSPIVTAQQMIGATAQGEGRRSDDRQIDVVVDDIHDSIATARVSSVPFREYVLLVRTSDGWRIVDTLWTPTRRG
jgi:hypothetical protein